QSNCGTAQPIFASGTWFGSTAGNPNNTGGSCGGGAGEAVFQLILFQPAHVIVDSIGTSFDSVLYVRSGNCGVGFELGCDDDCGASDFYVTECCDGTDENDNGIPDDFNCRCNNTGECDGGQICYDHTADSCGLPCTDFFGDVCPFVAPGSTCNQTTNQCEF